ncbi:hypothetical protein EBU71_11185 [bacterium]|nr:hypothetical protein [Candidatus Elulimicrobium humile]
MNIIWPWLLPLIPLTWGLIDVVRLKNFLEDRGWLKLALEKSELERLNIIRAILFALIIFFTILASGKTQLIVGIIGMIMGGLIMYYSESIHRVFGIGGGVNSKLRGDTQVKLVGLIMCILSALWMSGNTQGMLIWFLETSNLIPDTETVEFFN